MASRLDDVRPGHGGDNRPWAIGASPLFGRPRTIGPQPDFIGQDLDAISDQFIERYPGTANAS